MDWRKSLGVEKAHGVSGLMSPGIVGWGWKFNCFRLYSKVIGIQMAPYKVRRIIVREVGHPSLLLGGSSMVM